ncbi:prephenate dehydrogenase [Actinoplanes lutulentus]|uniref:Prephenate dehydrogenase n=1 Tax=Actinoplanes lutulentus TaxID=1287878 RepID=A0A327Z471_9ACTN|nr:prephenate dehydrogenase/arogenate dehydrogenase family protein [Actinoplanes lutulentus]MBB2945630.1 prephenate dehydrogenase [Actinoplanes lutulentus]RAK27228.1 prephenate dehydrogenase [Actinoplanes lutulentus]
MRIAVAGLGLIGGSLLRALDAAGHEVVGFDADPATRDAARAAGFPVAESLAEAASGSELTALGVPMPVLPQLITELAGYDGLVTDVTSVKGPVRDLVRAHGVGRFVGGHPMAGKETSGFAASEKDLFDGCAWVLCLEPGETDLGDWLTLARLFTGMGARVVPATADEHDAAVSKISHVPHLFASVLAAQISDDPLAGALGAGSFRDGTRVAATRPELTAAMCGGNRRSVQRELHRLIGLLEEMSGALDADDPGTALVPHLRLGAQARQAWPATPGEPATIPAAVPALLELGRSGGWVTSVGDGEVVALRPESGR